MTIGVDTNQRPFPPQTDIGELPTLLGYLRHHRWITEWKCSGLTEAQLRARPIPSTGLSLLGLVRHLAEVERSWIRHGVEREPDFHLIWCTEERPDAEFDDVDTADVAEAFERWHEEAAHADEAFNRLPLDHVFVNRHGERFSMRWLLNHLIEENARHNGHADLIREAIDGETGE
jgi:uncharacterized damage-inducible protein DinB